VGHSPTARVNVPEPQPSLAGSEVSTLGRFCPSTEVEGDALVVVAPDPFHGAFLEDNYRELLQDELRKAEDEPSVSGNGLRLRVSTKPGLGFVGAHHER
jgi:hypothetical protein